MKLSRQRTIARQANSCWRICDPIPYRWRQEGISVAESHPRRGDLAAVLGTGLRRSEVALLTWEIIQQRDGRWAIINTEHYLEPMRSLQVTAGDFIQIELALAMG